MKLKGLTLIEILISVALLTGVTLGALSALMYVFANNNAAIKLEEDRYNARMALLSVSREVHRGLAELPPETTTPLTRLELPMRDGSTVIYQITNGELARSFSDPTHSSPIPFAPVELHSFHATIKDNRLTISLAGEHGLEVESTIAMTRTPVSAVGS